jgi:hypothetical protein
LVGLTEIIKIKRRMTSNKLTDNELKFRLTQIRKAVKNPTCFNVQYMEDSTAQPFALVLIF